MKSTQKMITRVKGTRDILPEDTALWRHVENVARKVFRLYNYKEIRCPVFEKTEVFTRSIGDTTDIVEKEMYTLEDRGGASLTLRPEGTAGVARAFVENSLFNRPGAIKLYYIGPMFRAERPQAGRQRQFHQVGAEVFGPDDVAVDVEVILVMMRFFDQLGIAGLEVAINSLGCPQCRPQYTQALSGYLKGKYESLCDNCKRRVTKNPLRALDCKSATCSAVADQAPRIDQGLCDDCKNRLHGALELLDKLNVPARLDPSIVRGLDYYSGIAFEVTSGGLGAQNALAGGGRYNALVEQFGGPPTPAIGFAVGMERLISLLETPDMEDGPQVFIITLEAGAQGQGFALAEKLRGAGYRVDIGLGGASLKSQMRKANKSGARMAIIIGEQELTNSTAMVKDLEEGNQEQVPFGTIVEFIRAAIGQ